VVSGRKAGAVSPAYAPEGRALRIGAVSYLNALPHVFGLERDRGVQIVREVPSRIARRLHMGEIDLGIIPSVEYAFGRYAIVPGPAIASCGPVRSVALFHRGPLERVRRVALDTSSRASSTLVRILLRERLGRDPEYVSMAPNLVDMLAVADAALLIGDPALERQADAGRTDLGEEWTRMTGLPFVYAFWAGRPGAVTAAGVVRLQRALAEGLAERDAIAARQADGLPGRRELFQDYLRRNILFELGEREQQGLREFYRRAHALSLVPSVPELRFHGQD
jgi:chorismate dehydratase